MLLISAILGVAYLVYIVNHFWGTIFYSSSGVELVGGALATALVTPHMLSVCIAVIFNVIGWTMNKRWGALVAGIMYAVAILTMFLYGMFVIVQMVLCFIAFSRMKVLKVES